MLAGVLAYFTAELKAALSRKVTIYAIMAAGALLGLFAGGYMLDALHAFLAVRWGPMWASLAIAALLVVAAVVCIVVAGGMQARTAPLHREEMDARPERPIVQGRWWPQRRREMRSIVTVAGTLLGSAAAGIGGALLLRRAQGRWSRLRGWLRR